MTRRLIFSARKSDFRVDTFRSGGKGGQHQNKTDTGVRITHIESGLSAECRETRSQAENKKRAFRKLSDMLVERYVGEEQKERFAAGEETIRSYHEPNDRVTDHDTGDTYSYKYTIGKGDMSDLIAERRRKLALKEWP